MSGLFDILKPHTLELLRIAWTDAEDATGVVLGAFNLDNPNVQRIIADLKITVKGIEETTKEEVRALIAQQAEGGFGVDDVAEAIRAQGLERSKIRAETIAITATAEAYSRGSLLGYQESGVVEGTEWLVAPDNPCPVCAEIVATRPIVKLGEEFADGIQFPPAHSRCRCAIAPVVTA